MHQAISNSAWSKTIPTAGASGFTTELWLSGELYFLYFCVLWREVNQATKLTPGYLIKIPEAWQVKESIFIRNYSLSMDSKSSEIKKYGTQTCNSEYFLFPFSTPFSTSNQPLGISVVYQEHWNHPAGSLNNKSSTRRQWYMSNMANRTITWF